jgi:hypothetical protein
VTAALLQRLIEAGTPAALVAEVAMLAARAETDRVAIEQRRAGERARQAARRKSVSRDVTGDRVTDRDSPSLDKESGFPAPLPKEIKPIPRRPNARPGEGGRLDEGARLAPAFVPQIDGQTAEMVERWPPGRLDREIAQFRDHYARVSGERGFSRDWQASLRHWLRHADDRIGHATAHHARVHDGIGRTAAAAIAVFGQPAKNG